MARSFGFEDVLRIAIHSNVYVDTSYSLITTVMKINAKLFAEYAKALGQKSSYMEATMFLASHQRNMEQKDR